MVIVQGAVEAVVGMVLVGERVTHVACPRSVVHMRSLTCAVLFLVAFQFVSSSQWTWPPIRLDPTKAMELVGTIALGAPGLYPDPVHALKSPDDVRTAILTTCPLRDDPWECMASIEAAWRNFLVANFQSPTFLNFRPDGNGAAATLYDGFESLDTAARAWIALDDGQGTKTVPDNSTAQELAQATARTLFSVGRHYRVLLPRPVPVPYPFIESGYLSLLTRVLPNMVYGDDSVSPWTNRSMDERVRGIGRDWPERAHTMVGVARLMNTQFALQDVMARGVMGDFLEAGVWRGGVCILARAVLAVYSCSDRAVWAMDSFAGLPPPDPTHFPADANDTHFQVPFLSITQGQVEDNFRKYGLDPQDGTVRFVPGYFSDTMVPTAIHNITALAILRLDGDLYESTWVTLRSMYPKLSIGGYVICDDIILKTSMNAIQDYRSLLGLYGDALTTTDMDGGFWRRSGLPERLGAGSLFRPSAPRRLRWPVRLQLMSPSSSSVVIILPQLPCPTMSTPIPSYTTHTLASVVTFGASIRLAANVSLLIIVPFSTCVASNATVLDTLLLQVQRAVPTDFDNTELSAINTGEILESSGVVYNLSFLLHSSPPCPPIIDLVFAMGHFLPPPVTDPVLSAVCQLITTHTAAVDVASLPSLGFNMEYEEESGPILYIQRAACNQTSLAIAMKPPSGISDEAYPRPGSHPTAAFPPPLLPPPPFLYTTAVVISVTMCQGSFSTDVEASVSGAIERAWAFLRHPLTIAVVPVLHVNASDGLLNPWSQNIQRVYSGWNVTVLHAASTVAEAWTVGQQALSTSSDPDVLLFLSDDAIIDSTALYWADAASTGPGVYFPYTNAPRRRSLHSSVFKNRTEWQSDWSSSAINHSTYPVACDQHTPLFALPDSRVLAARASSLANVSFSSTDPTVDFRDDLIARVCSSLHPVFIVPTAYVWYDVITDERVVSPTHSGPTHFPPRIRLEV